MFREALKAVCNNQLDQTLRLKVKDETQFSALDSLGIAQLIGTSNLVICPKSSFYQEVHILSAKHHTLPTNPYPGEPNPLVYLEEQFFLKRDLRRPVNSKY